MPLTSARQALERLQSGNANFVAGAHSNHDHLGEARRAEVAVAQDPFAIILGCSDSRVPAELIFDQGIGDLFVIRVAGNIVAASQIGSVEFAAAAYKTRLVVVLGHSQCGAVGATLDALKHETGSSSKNLQFIVDRVRPSIEPLYEKLRTDPKQLYSEAVRANVRASVQQLRHGSTILEDHIEQNGLAIVGAEYSLETGVVDFFDGVSELKAENQ
jgi:carbonic anhydrase